MQKMINFDGVTKRKKCIIQIRTPDHPYRLLIVAGFRSGKD